MINIVESFSGIGAQTEALKRLKIEHEVSNTVEWEISAIYAYDILHNGPQNLKVYRHHTKQSLIDILTKYPLSNDGKNPLSLTGLSSMPFIHLKAIHQAIERNKNLVDIKSVTHADLSDEIDLLTYSFPCQDLSKSSSFWHNNLGINRDSGGQSCLLWEVERILSEFNQNQKPLPKFLLMENVSAILSRNHIDNFNMWKSFLTDLGYYNQIYTLNSMNFGVPQTRERTYMISILSDNDADLNQKLDNYFLINNLEQVVYTFRELPLENFLKLDYSIDRYRNEAIAATPNFTPSREKIYIDNLKLAVNDQPGRGIIARTITTKQDRNPNSGIVEFTPGSDLAKGGKYRNLTPREAFLLMGFNEDQFDSLIENSKKTENLLSDSKLLKLAGNSIVVNVLMAIFEQIQEISKLIEKRETD